MMNPEHEPSPSRPPAPEPGRRDWRGPGICLGLVLLIWAAYFQVRGFQFNNFDDMSYVTFNLHTRAGLSWGNLVWAFTTSWAANWHPLTWLSHMADISLFGLNAGPHHLVSVAFHTANSLLLFLMLRSLTRTTWPSALVAALFAIHPLHVESVAWVAERKDVLSMLFGLLSMWAYGENARRPSWRLRGAALGSLALGLMAKPMLVSLPILFCLLDYWPLGRIQGRASLRRLAWEKVPYALMALASCVVTVVVQRLGGAVISLERHPFHFRLGNALLSYVRYLVKMVYPFHLAPLYPIYWEEQNLWNTGFCAVLLLAVTAQVIRYRRERPYMLVGWFWYLITLLPVIGLVQVGAQAMADRYTYLPLTGIFIAGVWGARDLARSLRLRPWVLAVAAGPVLVLLTVRTYTQASYWRTSIQLWEHTRRVTLTNAMCQTNLASAYYLDGRIDQAVKAYRLAKRIKDDSSIIDFGLGSSLLAQGHLNEALDSFKQALARDPDDYGTVRLITGILMQSGRLEEAIPHYLELIRLEQVRLKDDPDRFRQFQVTQEARMSLGFIQRKLGREALALPWFEAAYHADPRDWTAAFNVAQSLGATGRSAEARAILETCVARFPGQPAFHRQLSVEWARTGNTAEAAREQRRAQELQAGLAAAKGLSGPSAHP